MEGWLTLHVARQPKAGARVRGKMGPALAASLLLVSLVPWIQTATAALPTEPTAVVTVFPNDPTVDASGVNPVDQSFMVNVTGNNIRPQPHQMWVNISFTTSTGWKLSPTTANITMTLAANGGTEMKSVAVTVTVPPKMSANNVSLFSASWRQENDVRFGTGQAGNATAQIHIRQIFSTSAELSNGTGQYLLRQGGDTNISMKVTNRGNGDATYDAELRNAADLRPSDILLKSTVAALVIQNGTATVLVVIHANQYAIAGSYQLQLRAIASGAGTPPPAGAFADLTAPLLVTASTPPPSQNNTTQPPPPQQNNTTTNNPPPSQPPDYLSVFWRALTSVPGMIVVGLVAVVAVGLMVGRGRKKKAARAREDALNKARERSGVGGPKKPGAPGPLPRPGAPGPLPRPGATGPAPVKPLPQRPVQRAAPRPGAPTPRSPAPPPK